MPEPLKVHYSDCDSIRGVGRCNCGVLCHGRDCDCCPIPESVPEGTEHPVERPIGETFLVTLQREWVVLDGTTPPGRRGHATIPAGTHRMERIRQPGGKAYWLVLEGTLTGMSEGAWRQWGMDDTWDRTDPAFVQIDPLSPEDA